MAQRKRRSAASKTSRKGPEATPMPKTGLNPRTRGKLDPPVSIREMELEDLPKVFALGEKLFRASEAQTLYRTWDEYELVDSFSADGEFCLVAEQGGRIVGFVIGTVIHKRNSAWTYGYLVWLGVEPELAGRGIARRLTQTLTELFIDDGARIMMVDTEAENDRALDFFRRIGFGNPTPHLYLSRNLTHLPEYRERRRQLEERESTAAQSLATAAQNKMEDDG